MRKLILFFAVLMLNPPVAAPALAETPEAAAMSSHQRPILYGTVWCPYCKAVRSWFRENQTAFTNCDIEKSANCRQQFIALHRKFGVRGVPVILYQGQVWGGYDEDQMEEIAEMLETQRSRPKE